MTLEPPQEGHRTTVVVYERSTGEIVHVHEVLTERGGRHPAPKVIEASALEYALEAPRTRPATARTLATLQLPKQFEPAPGHSYRVDPRTRRLVETPIRPKPRRRPAQAKRS
jgi:hypothetical protein